MGVFVFFFSWAVRSDDTLVLMACKARTKTPRLGQGFSLSAFSRGAIVPRQIKLVCGQRGAAPAQEDAVIVAHAEQQLDLCSGGVLRGRWEVDEEQLLPSPTGGWGGRRGPVRLEAGFC